MSDKGPKESISYLTFHSDVLLITSDKLLI